MIYKQLARLILSAILLPSAGWAGHLHPERYYQEKWCDAAGGQMEVVVNGVRADCLTSTQAVEFGFADHYREDLIQALEYAMYTGKRAVVVSICEEPEDQRYIDRARLVIKRYRLPVDLETMRP